VSDRRVVIVAPTVAEADGEAAELGIPRRQYSVATHPNALRGVVLTEADVVRVRESGWTDDLRDSLDTSLRGGTL